MDIGDYDTHDLLHTFFYETDDVLLKCYQEFFFLIIWGGVKELSVTAEMNHWIAATAAIIIKVNSGISPKQ